MSTPIPVGPHADEDLRRLWPALDAVPGWLTAEQAVTLWEAVRAAPPAPTVVEIGSHQGRSTAVLASARDDVRVVAVDPFVTTRRYAGPLVRGLLEDTLRRLGVAGRVTVVPRRSREALHDHAGPVDVLFVDGKHDALSLVLDLRWSRHVVPGGPVLVHDAFSSVGVTAGLLVRVGLGAGLTYDRRVGSLAVLTSRRPSLADRLRLLRPLPWFARNVVVKVLLRLRLRVVGRRLGHDDTADPY